MSNEASRDTAPRAPAIGGSPPAPAAVASSSRRITTPDALEEVVLDDDSRGGTPTPEGVASASHVDADGGVGVGVEAGLEAARRRSSRDVRREARVAAAARRAVISHTKLKFLTDFIRSLDMVVYFYYSYLYFLDNSFFRFFVRCAIQLNFLTPKPMNLPTPPQRRSVIIGLFGWTIVTLMIHILGSAPEAGEASAGWLHGGLLIDFVGQEGPISKLRLAITDLTILLLQLVMLAATIAKQGLLVGVTQERRDGDGGAGEGQDIDSEERGEIRMDRDGEEGDSDDNAHDDDNVDDTNDSEREGNSAGDDGTDSTTQRRRRRRRRRSTTSLSTNNDRQSLLGSSRRTSIGGAHEPGGSGRDDDGRYAQYSGQLLVAELSILDAVRWQWRHGTPGSIVSTPDSSGAEGGRRRARQVRVRPAEGVEVERERRAGV